MTSHRILIVDDNAVNRRVAECLVRALGFEADAVQSGWEAIEAVKANPYYLILMDLQMPGMDGMEAARQIRLLVAPEPPIVACSTSEPEQTRWQERMDGFLEKPLSIRNLADVLQRWHPDRPVPIPEIPRS